MARDGRPVARPMRIRSCSSVSFFRKDWSVLSLVVETRSVM